MMGRREIELFCVFFPHRRGGEESSLNFYTQTARTFNVGGEDEGQRWAGNGRQI